MMGRETISRHALDRMINERMQGCDQCRDMVATIAPDDARCSGANWRVSMQARSGPDGVDAACTEAMRDYLRELADRYDVPDRVPSQDELKWWVKKIPSKACLASPMSEPVPPHVLDNLLDSKFVALIGGELERTPSGDQVAAG
jgi:hypothetical protein